MLNKKSFPMTLIFLGGLLSLYCQQGVSLSLTPGLDIPSGGGDRSSGTYTLSGEEEIYSMGGGSSLNGNWGLASYPLFLTVGLDLSFINTVNDKKMTFVALTGGVGYDYTTYMYNFRGYLAMGSALGSYYTDNTANFYGKMGGSFLFNISPTLSAGPTGELRYFNSNYNGIFLGLTTKWAPAPPISEDQARYIGIQLAPLYPALYRNYQAYPPGIISFVNGEDEAIEDLEIRFYLKDYMEKPALCGAYARVESGKTISVPLAIELTEKILSNREETSLMGEIVIRYRYNGRNHSLKTTKPIILAEAHRIIDDLPVKQALFVTPEEPSLVMYADSVKDQLEEVSITPVDRNFRTALGLYRALSNEEISLKPTSNVQKAIEKSVQFPVETLALKSGDEKDLVIAYAALLEAAGIESALLQLPGKTMAALALGLPRHEAQSILDEGDYIDYGGKIWLPLDLSDLENNGFIAAWMLALTTWKETSEAERTLIDVRNTWERYLPVKNYPYAEQAGLIPLTQAKPLIEDYKEEMTAFVEKSISREEKILLDKINRTGDIRTKNRLGVLYARYGLLEKAKDQFEPLSYDYEPAAINMGNIFFLEGDYVKAYINYVAAVEMRPTNKYALLGKARTAREVGELETARLTYHALSAADINLAIPFAYIIEGGQSEIDENTREMVFWVEE